MKMETIFFLIYATTIIYNVIVFWNFGKPRHSPPPFLFFLGGAFLATGAVFALEIDTIWRWPVGVLFLLGDWFFIILAYGLAINIKDKIKSKNIDKDSE